MAANRFLDFVYMGWPRVLAIQRVYQANMDLPHVMARPIVHAMLTSPMRFPGVKPQRNDSVITVQSRLRGVPYFNAVRMEQARRQALYIGRQNPPPVQR